MGNARRWGEKEKSERHLSIFKHLRKAPELLRMARKVLRKKSPKYTSELRLPRALHSPRVGRGVFCSLSWLTFPASAQLEKGPRAERRLLQWQRSARLLPLPDAARSVSCTAEQLPSPPGRPPSPVSLPALYETLAVPAADSSELQGRAAEEGAERKEVCDQQKPRRDGVTRLLWTAEDWLAGNQG